MADCSFNSDGPPWQCEQCGWIYARDDKPIMSDKPPRVNCPNPPNLKPAAEKLGIKLDDIPHYAQALARWLAAGFPVRTQAEVHRILREHCNETCEAYVKGKCRLCRCNVTASRFAVANKVKMATESCPLEKW